MVNSIVDRSSDDDKAVKNLIKCIMKEDAIKKDTKEKLTDLLNWSGYDPTIVSYLIKECEETYSNKYLSVTKFPRKRWGYVPHKFRESIYNKLQDMREELQNLTSPKDLDGIHMPVYNLLRFFVESKKDGDIVKHLDDLPTNMIAYLPVEILEEVYRQLKIQEKKGQLTHGIEGSQVKYLKVKSLLHIEDHNSDNKA